MITSPIANPVMQKKREPKWDWATHFPRMVDLYNSGQSITKISEAIQCDGFRPSQRAVYDKFRSEGYSTEHGRRSRYPPGASLARNTEGSGTPLFGQSYPLTQGNAVSNVSSTRDTTAQSRDFDRRSDHHNSRGHKRRNVKNTPEQQIELLMGINLQQSSLTQHDGGRKKHPHHTKEGSERATESGVIRKIQSLTGAFFESKNSYSKARAKQDSPFADNDSGYHSQCSDYGTLQWRDSLMSQLEPLTEFRREFEGVQGPYRVDCPFLHEPKFPNEYREKQPCHFCRYSNIHNLAWVGGNLRLQEFEDELRMNDLYKFKALDAAGNSALHYAAASGASYAHLNALIDAGVPTDTRNTANQNFLHCLGLPPCNIGLDGWEAPDRLKDDLTMLLGRLDPKIIFGQQDNDGRTVLHALASHITEPELRERIFNVFSERGSPPVILDRFKKSAKRVFPSTYKFPQGIVASATFDTMSTSTLNLELPETSERENNAFSTIAVNNPRSFDNKTKDTILHWLSKLNTSKGIGQSIDIIQYLRDSVLKGAYLNWHNHDGHHPLSAFICYKSLRENDETGAILAECINVLLWKDYSNRELNDINVNMMNHEGATALHEAAVRAQPYTVRSLIEAGANVNARLHNAERGPSVLQATLAACDATPTNDLVSHHMFKEVVWQLEQAGAVVDPASLQERSRLT